MPGKITKKLAVKKTATRKKPAAKKPAVKKAASKKKRPMTALERARHKRANGANDSATLKRLRRQHPNSHVTPIRNSSNYRLVSKKGGASVTITPGRNKKK